MHKQWRSLRIVTRTALAILLSGLVFAYHATAQTVTGAIYGTVTDVSGALIAHAAVTTTNVDTGEAHTTNTNEAGSYLFPALSPGRYRVATKMSGFSTVDQSGIVLAANQNVNVSFVMKPGEAQMTINVSADTTLVDTRESTISTTIEHDSIENLPIVDRKAYGLVVLVPGVTNYLSGSPIGDQNNSQFSINGLPGNYNSYYLDGSYNTSFFHQGGNLPPNPDAIAQFSILTSNQDAEFGRYPGAVVNAITRSGDNKFHGGVFDYLRNTILNAKNYFNNVVTPLHYNVYGANLGGPVVHDKLFFFSSYQGIRLNTMGTVNSVAIVVPSDLERQGNFSQSTKKPTANGCFGGTPTPPATICMSPVAVALLKYIPPAVTSVNGVNHPAQQNAPANTDGDQGLGRLDYQLNAAHKLQLTFFQARGTKQYPTGNSTNQIYDYTGALYNDNQSNYVVGDTWIISPRAVNTFSFLYSLHNTRGVPSFPGSRLADLGSTIPEGNPQGLSTQPTYTVTGYWVMGGGNPTNATFSQFTYGVSDTLNYMRGTHAVKFGGEFLEDRFQETSVGQGSSVNNFSGAHTGNALADFLEGFAQKFSQDTGLYSRNHSFDPALFAQDNWRVARRLTLNLGVRWEAFNFFAGQNQNSTFIPGMQSNIFPTAPAGLVFSGDPGIPSGIGHTSYVRFAPRVGFAEDVWGNGRLALKGAFGIFYTTTPLFYTNFLRQQPYARALTLNQTTSLVDPYNSISPYNGVSPFGAPFDPKNVTFSPGATLYSLVPHTSATPYVEEYNLAIEQQLGQSWSLKIAYVGNSARKFYLPRDENAALYAPGATTVNTNIQSRRPYQPEATIELFDNANNFNYNALQVSVAHPFAKHYSLLASYVWSKSFDLTDVSPTSGNADMTLADQNNPKMDYGLSTNQAGQVFKSAFSDTLPTVSHFGIIGREVLSGWRIDGIVILQTGTPFNVTSNRDANFDGFLTDRPDTIGNPSLGSHRSRAQKIAEYFNTAAFAQPQAGVLYGNTHRNSLIGPGYVDADLAGSKQFQLRDRLALKFRGELFNAFNNVNLNAPGATLGTVKFGQISGSGSPRIVQFALRLQF